MPQKTRTTPKLKAIVAAAPAAAKPPSRRKATSCPESKADREEARAVTRGGKGKRKPSALQQGFNKPAQVVNRDVVIGETITVAELANKMAVKVLRSSK